MSFLLAQLLIDGPSAFFTLDTLLGFVAFTGIAKAIEILGLEILERLPGQRGPETLAEAQAKHAGKSVIPCDRMARALR